MKMTGKPGEGRGRVSRLPKPDRFLFYFLVSFTSICLLPQCGLEYIPYLSEPLSLGSFVDDTFQFIRTTENTEAEFLGFEIYYKFYKTDQSPDDTITDFNTLITRGFRRLSSSTDDPDLISISEPLIKIPSTNVDTITFTIDFSPLFPNEPTTLNDSTITNVILRRGVYYGSGTFDQQYKHFHKNFDPNTYLQGDADLGSDIMQEITNGIELRLALYVLSYGLKEFTLDIFSDAVYLNYIDVNFGW